MMGLQPTGPTRVNLEVIVPSPQGLTPAMWKETATLCPLEWPSNFRLLRLWHTPKSFHQHAAQLKQQVQHRHMFTHWEVNRGKLASRVLFQRPAHYLPETILQQHVREHIFPDRKLRRRAPDTNMVAFQTKCNELCLLTAEAERANPVSFAIGNSWNDTLRADKQHHLEYTTRSQTQIFRFPFPRCPCLGRPSLSYFVSSLSVVVVSFGPLLQLFGTPFAPVGTHLLAPLCPASPLLVFDI